MEENEIKNIFYFVIAVLWFVFSIFNKNLKNKKEKSIPKQKPAPNIFEEVIKEFKQSKEEVSTPIHKPATSNKTIKKTTVNEIPEEVLAAQIRKQQREKASKQSKNEKNEEIENEHTLLENIDYQNTYLQKMVIFTEIFNRPNY